MARRDLKWPENVTGDYYVDEKCIASKFCMAVAPDHFAMSPEGHAYVYRQPRTPEEEERCQEAFRGCPVAAIGNDQESS
jgi:ferredoxin